MIHRPDAKSAKQSAKRIIPLAFLASWRLKIVSA
jgi:hypothetical protein